MPPDAQPSNHEASFPLCPGHLLWLTRSAGTRFTDTVSINAISSAINLEGLSVKHWHSAGECFGYLLEEGYMSLTTALDTCTAIKDLGFQNVFRLRLAGGQPDSVSVTVDIGEPIIWIRKTIRLTWKLLTCELSRCLLNGGRNLHCLICLESWLKHR